MIRYDRYIHKDVGRRGDDAGGQRALTPLLSLGGGGGVQLVRNNGTRARQSRGNPFDNKAWSKV
jgi:hypothetical protein